jgi:hypothetical protein
MSFENIPLELRQYRQFICWRLEETDTGKPTKLPYCPQTGKLASVTNPLTWASYDEALAASVDYSGVGFVLTEEDPYTFIDLDEPHDVDDETRIMIYNRQLKVFNEFNSYAETSPSGKGLHIIVKGSIPAGRKRSAIEIYSSVRYMTLTGKIYRDLPINNHNDLLQQLYKQMGGGVVNYCVSNCEQKEEDEEIIQKAFNAVNGEKFHDLLLGNWPDHYPSQSEADFALINIIAFYTQNTQQIARIFRNSGLGKRKKALRDDYINYMVNRSFDRMLPPIDLDGLRNQMEEALCTKNRLPNLPSKPLKQSPPTIDLPETSPYSLPPGLVGEIAQFIYDASPRQVKEIALAGAIGLMAGVCGRSYNISGTGLNQYVLLIGDTGVGKEALSLGADKLIKPILATVPSAEEFIGPGEIASPQALIKYLGYGSSSFVSQVDEFGMKLQEMTAMNASPNQEGLKRAFHFLFSKSGEGQSLKGSIYSEKEKNTKPIMAPAFSVLGESTPEEFYKCLNERMITSGLLPRFFIIEYKGKRGYLNKGHEKIKPDFQLIERFGALCAHSLTLNNSNKAVHVEMTQDAEFELNRFDQETTDIINENKQDVRKRIWNRAHIKVLKLAALVAVGINPYSPQVDMNCVNWAKRLIMADINNLISKFESGEVGDDTEETKQIDEVKRVIKEYIKNDWSEVEKYKASQSKLHQDKVITLTYIQRRLMGTACFRKDKLGATRSIHKVVETLKDQGMLIEIGKSQILKEYNFNGKCFSASVSMLL